MPGMPERRDWVALKRKHHVEDGAVKGINVGKAIDDYWHGLKQGVRYAQANSEVCEKLEKILANYIGKLDKKKVGVDFNGFQKTFLDDYVNIARRTKVDYSRQIADIDTLKHELSSFFTMVQKLPAGHTQREDLERFQQGPLRGLTAVGGRMRGAGHDLAVLDRACENMSDLIDEAAGKDAEAIEQARAEILELAKHLAHDLREQGLF